MYYAFNNLRSYKQHKQQSIMTMIELDCITSPGNGTTPNNHKFETNKK